MNVNDVSSALYYGKTLLKQQGIASYALDAALLLSHVTGISRGRLPIESGSPLTLAQQEHYNELLRLRSSHMPLQYILNSCEFMSLDFFVDENVLIPRPDTEILVEKAISVINERNMTEALELCTGSGCIAISVARYCPRARVTATDISGRALGIAAENARSNGVYDRISFVESDLFRNLVPPPGGFDILMANPPYIPEKEADTLPVNVKGFEPSIALFGGADGLRFYREIAMQCKGLLKSGAALILEIGWNQGREVSGILYDNGFDNIEIVKDLAGLDRVVFAYEIRKD